MTDESQQVREGWLVELQGESADLDDWKRTLNPPFDPVAYSLPDGRTVLRSSEFEGFVAADEVRGKGLMLIARLNGALRLMNNSQPLRIGGVIKVDKNGRLHRTVFMEAVGIAAGRATMTATAVVIGPDGKPLPPPPPQPSEPQKWIALADKEDLVAELLDHFGRADNWYEIYKTIEVAEKLVGGEKKLQYLMGSTAAELKILRTTANYHRHFQTHKPSRTMTLSEGKSVLSTIVRSALEKVSNPK